ncbi:hypothetical protein GN958_ATG06925, partial [Phytophthora infestans]
DAKTLSTLSAGDQASSPGDRGVWEETAKELAKHVTGGEEVFAHPRGGKREGKVTDACLSFWLKKLGDDPDLTLRQLADALEHEHDVVLSINTSRR